MDNKSYMIVFARIKLKLSKKNFALPAKSFGSYLVAIRVYTPP